MHRKRTFSIVIAVIMLLGTLGSGQTITEASTNSFTPQETYASGTNPFKAEAADYNKDGNIDLLTIDMDTNNAYLHLGNGDGTFQTAVQIPTGPAPTPGPARNPVSGARGMASGDFNGDDNPDFAAEYIVYSSKSSISILNGNGAAAFSESGLGSTYSDGSRCFSAGDFNGDGKNDLAVADTNSCNVEIWLVVGSALIRQPSVPTGTFPKDITCADFNTDGKLDIAVVNNVSNNISVMLGNGNGTLQPPCHYAVGVSPQSITAADFNMDGNADLAVSNYTGNNVSVLLGTGTGPFGAQVNYPAGSGPMSIASGDFSGDGKPDLAVANRISNTVTILAGDGTGCFSIRNAIAAGNRPAGLVAADYNKDGMLDLAVVNYSSNDISVILNSLFDITTTTLPDGTKGSAYTSGALTAAGGCEPYTWSASGLPAGLSINGSTGVISGTPTGTGTSTVTITAADDNGVSTSKDISLEISEMTYSVNIGTLTGGTIDSNPQIAAEGAIINLTITPDSGKQLRAGTLKYNDGADHTISGTSFTMPAADVTVNAEFEDIPPVITDADKVAADKDALYIGFNALEDAEHVKGNISLAEKGTLYESDILWSTADGDDDVIIISGTEGIVTRPAFSSGDRNVTVTAHVYNGTASDTRDFHLKVLKLEQVKYTITIGTLTGGSITAAPETAGAGTTVSVTVTPDSGKRLKAGTLKYVDGADHTITGTSFVMPESNVTVTAEFESIPDPNNSRHNKTHRTTSASNVDSSATVKSSQMSEALAKAVGSASNQGQGQKTIAEIIVTAPADSKDTEITIDKSAFDMAVDSGIDGLIISTPVASIKLDKKSLAGIAAETDGDIRITASRVEPSRLSQEARRLVGDRPVFDFTVTSGDKTISQFRGKVEVYVPYTPAPQEDTDAIVIYYINAEGNPEIVQNCRYDAASGSLIFKTTHFSKFAVGYNKVSFKDIEAGTTYSKAVTFIAARNIAKGTGEGSFSPEAVLTRGQFVVMLLKAYGINPEADAKDNFADAGNTYYTGYIAAAKRIGIANGTGNNRYEPEKPITLQEMLTLVYKASKLLDVLPEGTAAYHPSDLIDKEKLASWAEETYTQLGNAGVIPINWKKLNPEGSANRAQMAQLLSKLLSN